MQRKNSQKKTQTANNEMMNLNPFIAIIPFSVNGVNASIRRQRSSD